MIKISKIVLGMSFKRRLVIASVPGSLREGGRREPGTEASLVRPGDISNCHCILCYTPEEDGTHHVIKDFIWEMSIRTISTKVEGVSHKNL